MYEVKRKVILNDAAFEMDVYAPLVAKKCEPGQFIIARVGEDGERIPLTIGDYDPEKGTVTIVVQAVGFSTKQMLKLEEGDSFTDFVGPLGVPTKLNPEHKHVIGVAGGIGSAPVYPQLKKLAEMGCKVDVIIGGRAKQYVLWAEKFDEVIAIGPVIMMKNVVRVTKPYNIPTSVSLNPIMVDGTGMCGCCRVTVDGKIKFACVDGPDFDGLTVDFDELMARQRMFKEEEHHVDENANHICNLMRGVE